MSAQDGGPAFAYSGHVPLISADTGEVVGTEMVYHAGMTLRDWFAGQALAGLAGNSHDECYRAPPDKHAEWAYQEAEAMLAERAKGGGK